MRNLKDYIFPTLVGFCALAVSGSAAFYSVTGLSKLFAGASLQVMVMAGSLELSKLVIASLLYRYWEELNKTLKYYLTVAAGILIIITSMGIYGFLSAAYQETASIYEINNTETIFLEQKENFFTSELNRFDSELERISSTISELSKARAREIQISDTSAPGGIRNTISTSELRLAQERLRLEEVNRTEVIERRDITADSLRSVQEQLLNLKVDNAVVSELGPLIYLSNVTGASMDSIVNILLLTIIFVFDPLAVSLVVAANFAFLQINPPKKELELYNPSTYLEEEPETTNVEEEQPQVEEEVEQENLVEEHKEETEKPKEPPLTEKEEEQAKEYFVNDETDSDWEVEIDPIEDDLEDEEETNPSNNIVRILQKTPSKYRVLYEDGTESWILKKDYEPN